MNDDLNSVHGIMVKEAFIFEVLTVKMAMVIL